MLLFYFLTCVQKVKSIFQVKVAKFLIRPEIGDSTLVNDVHRDGPCHKLQQFLLPVVFLTCTCNLTMPCGLLFFSLTHAIYQCHVVVVSNLVTLQGGCLYHFMEEGLLKYLSLKSILNGGR
jgi:hypothetical protein